MPTVVLDTDGNNVGVAQSTARAHGAQARIIWIDAGANVGNLNSVDKIKDVVDKIKRSGFNMVVLDVKPIVGDTIYNSQYAPRLLEWRGKKGDPTIDVVQTVLDDAHQDGLTVYANFSTFSEGHKMVQRGLAYTHPSWQTVLYETDRTVQGRHAVIGVSRVDALPPDDQSIAEIVLKPQILTKAQKGYTIALLNFDARVVAVYDPSATLDAAPAPPPGGFAVIGRGQAGRWIAEHAVVGEIMILGARPDYMPIAADNTGDQMYSVFVDPHNPEVRQHEIDIVREAVSRYDFDGVIFDDRLRYAGLNADFGPDSRAAFEKYVGHRLTWPDDVFRAPLFPTGRITPGPNYEQWLVWRAENITGWLDEAAAAVRAIRPSAQVAVYAGSWYGDYDEVASNWAAPDFAGPYPWDTPDYRATGFASKLDWITTGCYYSIPTIDDARHSRDDPGKTVEGGGQLSNHVVNDATWTYAGLYALVYTHNVRGFQEAIQAALASTQGVMVFDLSQIIDYDWWDDIAAVFGSGGPPPAPNTLPGLLESVRTQHARDVAAGKPQPPLPDFLGEPGIGF